MNGNSFFTWQAQTFDMLDELQSTARVFTCRNEYPKLNFETEWEQAVEEIEGFGETEKIDFEEPIAKRILSSEQKQISLVTTEKLKEIRMQEIEEIIMQNAIFRNIDGNLCIWNGRYYRKLNLSLFTQEVRRLLSKDSQKRISRFGRFREAYEYMMANERLREQFAEKDIAAAKHMIVFQNGIYDAGKNMLIQSTPNYPVLFEINAQYLGDVEVETPYMDRIINQATGNDREVLERFYQSLGYLYSQGMEAKKCFIFGTAPDSGKSIIGEFIGKIMGEDNVSTISLNDFGTRFALGTINQKALNYNMDLPATELNRNAVQKIKQLTGDARIDCEEKYVQSKTVMHHCKFLFATNHPIRLKYEDEAFYRRLLLIPFIYSVSDKDKDYQMLEKLWKERHAIATKAAHAYHDLYRNNFVFQESILADTMLNEWKNAGKSDILKEFACQCCEIMPEDTDAFVPTDVLFKAFQTFCAQRDKQVLDREKVQFSKMFHSILKIPSDKRRVKGYSSPVNGYIGIRLL